MEKGRNKKIKIRRGQSLIEYILLLTVVIIVMLALFGKNTIFKEEYTNIIEKQGNDLTNMAARIFDN